MVVETLQLEINILSAFEVTGICLLIFLSLKKGWGSTGQMSPSHGSTTNNGVPLDKGKKDRVSIDLKYIFNTACLLNH